MIGINAAHGSQSTFCFCRPSSEMHHFTQIWRPALRRVAHSLRVAAMVAPWHTLRLLAVRPLTHLIWHDYTTMLRQLHKNWLENAAICDALQLETSHSGLQLPGLWCTIVQISATSGNPRRSYQSSRSKHVEYNAPAPETSGLDCSHCTSVTCLLLSVNDIVHSRRFSYCLEMSLPKAQQMPKMSYFFQFRHRPPSWISLEMDFAHCAASKLAYQRTKFHYIRAMRGWVINDPTNFRRPLLGDKFIILLGGDWTKLPTLGRTQSNHRRYKWIF